MSVVDPRTCIDQPDLLTARERARDTLMTAGMWGAYLYLWVPLASLAAWLLGFEFSYEVMVRAGGARDLERTLAIFGIAILLIFVVVTGWSLNNRIRFRGRNRRQAGPAVADAAVAQYFGVEVPSLETLRASRRAEIEFAPDGLPRLRFSLPARPQGTVARQKRGTDSGEQQAVRLAAASSQAEERAENRDDDERGQKQQLQHELPLGGRSSS